MISSENKETHIILIERHSYEQACQKKINLQLSYTKLNKNLKVRNGIHMFTGYALAIFKIQVFMILCTKKKKKKKKKLEKYF